MSNLKEKREKRVQTDLTPSQHQKLIELVENSNEVITISTLVYYSINRAIKEGVLDRFINTINK